MKKHMKLSERVLAGRYEKPKEKYWVQMVVKIDRPIAYEFKRIAKQKGFTYVEILDTAIKQFIAEERPCKHEPRD